MNTWLKSILLGTFIVLNVSSVRAFDFEMPSEEPGDKAPAKKTGQKKALKPKGIKKKPFAKKASQKKAEKSKPKAGKKIQKLKKDGKKKSVPLKAKSVRYRDQETKDWGCSSVEDPHAKMSHPATPAGYFSIPGTNTALKIGGYIKADAIYDASQFTGDSSNLATLRLRNLDPDAVRSNVWTAHVKQSRISLASETHTANGQVMTYFEGDFFGASNAGSSAGSFSRSDTSSLNSYNFRVRHAYGSYCYNNKHRVDIGQMWTLFYDPKSAGTTVEFNGPETTAQIRHPQIRYTCVHRRWKFSASLESGATEYLDITPSFAGTAVGSLAAGSPSTTYNTSQYRRAQSTFLGGSSGDGNQALPDLVGQVVYEKPHVGHISVGMMVRQLKVNKAASTGTGDPAFSAARFGYGIALGGRYYIRGKSNIFGQMNFGNGIGSYIFGLDGYGAAIDASRGRMQTQFAYGFLMGVEHYWNEKWRTNIIFSQARANVASFIPGGKVPVMGLVGGVSTPIATTGYSISNLLRQFYLNLLWTPAEKFEVGVEYAYFRRETINNYFGYGNRFQFGAYYKF